MVQLSLVFMRRNKFLSLQKLQPWQQGRRRCCLHVTRLSSSSSSSCSSQQEEKLQATKTNATDGRTKTTTSATTSSSTATDTTTVDDVDKILKAPFRKTNATTKPPSSTVLFPWRHEERPLDRYIPGTQDYYDKRHLIGEDLDIENLNAYGLFTAYSFLNVPWYQCILFNNWKKDLANSYSWAFTQGVSGILSNVYQVSFNDVSMGDYHLDFKTKLNEETEEIEDNANGKAATTTSSTESEQSWCSTDDACNAMMEKKLQSLFQSAHENGKDKLEIRLEMKPISNLSQIVSLVGFPFLTRKKVMKDSTFKDRYREMMFLMENNPFDPPPMLHELITEFNEMEVMETTVICQALIPCNEIFIVKDLNAGGKVIQGHDDGLVRTVWHQVRMEMIVETRPIEKRGNKFIPFKNTQGNWQITDIDDLLGGNLLI